MQSRHVLPAHLRRLADGLDRFRLPLGARAVPLDDLIAALPVDLVRLDVDREELDLVVREALARLQRR
jgi:hypothetical protein